MVFHKKQLRFFHFLKRNLFFYRVSPKTTDSSKVTVSGCKIGPAVVVVVVAVAVVLVMVLWGKCF